MGFPLEAVIPPARRVWTSLSDDQLLAQCQVDTYRASLMRKLKVYDLVGLVKFAIERNLTTTTSPQR